MTKRRWLMLVGLVAVLVAVPATLAAGPGGGENPPGSKFKFYGTAINGSDPQNAFNDVVSIDTRNANYGGLERKLPDHVQVGSLTNELALKYYFVGRGCEAGSPRISLLIDPGDHSGQREIFGYVGNPTFGGGCAMNHWTYQDLSQGPQWDMTQFGQGYGNTWAQVVAYFNSTYPNHRVVEGFLDDDSSTFSTADQGCAYYDLVSVGARTYTSQDDADGKGDNAKQNTCP